MTSSRVEGLMLAEVAETDDPEKLGQVRLRFPALTGEALSDWTPILRPLASGGFGFWMQPLKGDLVVVGFLGGSLGRPVVLGAIFHADAAPPSERQEQRLLFKTEAGHSLSFDDAEGQAAVVIEDASGGRITMDKDGIRIESPKAVTITGVEVKIEAEGQLTAKGAPIHLNP